MRSCLLLLIAGGGAICAQTPDLSNIAVEDLLDMQVSSVSRKAQRVVKSPAAVYVITQEEIRRSGATVLADVLRVVPGVNVGELTGASWAISIRGGQRQLANKVLVLIDGRSVYNNYYGGTYWHMEDVVLENVDRIEVIRGPGAVMWGSNATNGVINIITMKAKNTEGGMASFISGGRDHAMVMGRFGGSIGKQGHYRIYGKGRSRETNLEGDPLAYPNFFKTTLEPVMGPMPVWFSFADKYKGQWNAIQGGFRYDWENESGKSLTMAADINSGSSGIPYGRLKLSERSPLLQQAGDQFLAGNVLARWASSKNPDEETAYQFWYDRQQTDFVGAVDTFDGEFQKRWLARENHEMFLTLGARGIRDSTNPSLPELRFVPSQFTRSIFSAVIRDDWQLRRDRLLLSAGLRLEHNTFTGLEWQPSIRLAYTPTANKTLWVAGSRAVRLPTRLERTVEYNIRDMIGRMPVQQLLQGNNNFQAERMYGAESGFRYQRTSRWMVDAAVFQSWYSRLWALQSLPVTFTPQGALLRLESANTNEGTAYGVELSAAIQNGTRWKLMAGYAWLRQDIGSGRPRPTSYFASSPQHVGSLRQFWQPIRGLQWDNTVFLASAIPREEVRGYIRWDSRLSWRVNRNYELTLTGQDLANNRRIEFYPDTISFSVRTRRAIVIGLQTRW